MIIVTGATGQLGPAIISQLLTRIPADRMVATTRNPGKATALIAQGVVVRQADFDDPESLRGAFQGATQVLVISTNSTGHKAVGQRCTAIEAARTAGAKRILYTGHMGSRPDSPFPPMPDHAATEPFCRRWICPSSRCATACTPPMRSALCRGAFLTGELYAPEDGKVAWTMHADLAEAAAIVLADEGRLDGITAPLIAPEAFDMADLVAIASGLTGRKIKRITVPDGKWRENMVSHGVPEPQADLLVGLFQAARRGDFSAVDQTLETLLGHANLAMR